MAPAGRGKGTRRSGAGAGTRSRDKGTRGGRPEPQAARQARPSSARKPGSQVPRARDGQAGDGQARRGPNGARPASPARPAPAAAGPGGMARIWQPIARHPVEILSGLLSVIGLGLSVYLTIAHYTTPKLLLCSSKGLINCEAVTTSPESMVFGIFPVAVLGLAFYVFMAAVNSPWGWRAPWPALRWLRLGSVIVGIVFVLYLVYTELFTLNAICLWCTSVHVVTFLLFCVIVFAAASGHGNKPREPSAGS